MIIEGRVDVEKITQIDYDNGIQTIEIDGIMSGNKVTFEETRRYQNDTWEIFFKLREDEKYTDDELYHRIMPHISTKIDRKYLKIDGKLS